MKLNKKIVFKTEYYYYKMMVDIYCVVFNIPMAPQVKNTFIFFCMFGVNDLTYKRILHNKIAASLNVIFNYKTRLASLGLVKKVKSGKWQVSEEFTEDLESVFNITLNNEGKKTES